MNFGQRSRDLLLDLKRSEGSSLPSYDDDSVRSILIEIQWHLDELESLLQSYNNHDKPPMEARPALLLHDASIRRNKRALLAYQNYRITKVKNPPRSSLTMVSSWVLRATSLGIPGDDVGG